MSPISATVRELAHRFGLAYALGIHPLCVDRAGDGDLQRADAALARHRDDPRLVAVGEIGIDHFIAGLSRERQEHFYAEQLALARPRLPVIVHVRRSADTLLKHLRRNAGCRGIAHAFNGSAQQADGVCRSRLQARLRRRDDIRPRAADPPAGAGAAGRRIVLETDSPDIPPHWLYRTAAEREAAATAARRATSRRNCRASPPNWHSCAASRRAELAEQTRRQCAGRAAAAARPGRAAALVSGAARRAPAAAGRRGAAAMPGSAAPLQGLAPVVGPTTRLIVLGSFPGVASLQAQQYYAHPRNQFWPILSALWRLDLLALPYPQRLEVLLAHGLGLWDVYAACRREGSLDSAIEQAELNDLASLRRLAPRLQAVAHNGGESARQRRHTEALGVDGDAAAVDQPGQCQLVVRAQAAGLARRTDDHGVA